MSEGQSYLLLIRDEGGQPEQQVSPQQHTSNLRILPLILPFHDYLRHLTLFHYISFQCSCFIALQRNNGILIRPNVEFIARFRDIQPALEKLVSVLVLGGRSDFGVQRRG